MACVILVPRAGIEPTPPAVEAWSLNHWTAREVPHPAHFCLRVFALGISSARDTPSLKTHAWLEFPIYKDAIHCHLLRWHSSVGIYSSSTSHSLCLTLFFFLVLTIT